MEFPVEHLSASSINMFLRCPRQWQQHYVLGLDDGPVGEPLIRGSAVHLALSRLLVGKDPGDFFGDVMAEEAREIVITDMDKLRNQVEADIYHYYETVGKYLDVVSTENEIVLDVGLPIPVVGYVDIVCKDRIIDIKTTNYLSRNVKLNPEWRTQAHVYQLAHPHPAEFHVLTRSKTDPLILPGSPSDKLYISPTDPAKTRASIIDTYNQIALLMESYGEDTPWPGNPNHEWANKYCPVPDCCGRF